jgi:hypothetical protein
VLQYYQECFCADTFGGFGELALESCNTPCNADEKFMCGGKNAIDVYSGMTAWVHFCATGRRLYILLRLNNFFLVKGVQQIPYHKYPNFCVFHDDATDLTDV